MFHIDRTQFRLLALGLFLGGCTSCSGDSAGPSINTGEIDHVTVTPGQAVLSKQDQQEFKATAFSESGAVLSGISFDWSTSDPSVATVTAAGVVSAVGAGSATIAASNGGVSGEANVTVTPSTPSGSVVDVYPTATYQTMRGWEGSTQIGQVECNQTSFPLYHDELIDRIVNELGVNRVRLVIRSGSENPTDFFTQAWITHTILPATYMTKRYEIINDNSDPHSANLAGFHFPELDLQVTAVVNPMRQLLAARGEKLYVNLNYIDFEPSAFEHFSKPAEYAEFLLVVFQHLQSKFGWVPDAVEVILEPDNSTSWTPAAIGAAIVAAGDRLKAAGFDPDFIAPSNKNMTGALEWFDQIIQVPRVREYLTDIAYHRYGGVSSASLQSIGRRTTQWGVRSGMLEKIGATVNELYADLTQGMNSEWAQYSLAYCGGTTNGGVYYNLDLSSPAQPRIIMDSRAKLLRQYFLFVRYGAVRVGAASGNSQLDPVAFRNTNGKLVVVVKADAAVSFEVRLLPPGTYGINYSTASQFDVDKVDVTIGAGGTVPVTIPAAGVVTIYRK
jgi:hypothetical protein